MSTLSHEIVTSQSSNVSGFSLAIVVETLGANETLEMFDMIDIKMTMSVRSLTETATKYVAFTYSSCVKAFPRHNNRNKSPRALTKLLQFSRSIFNPTYYRHHRY